MRTFLAIATVVAANAALSTNSVAVLAAGAIFLRGTIVFGRSMLGLYQRYPFNASLTSGR